MALGGAGWDGATLGNGVCASATGAPTEMTGGNAIAVSNRARNRLIDPIAIAGNAAQYAFPQSRKVVAEPGHSSPGPESISCYFALTK
jgi:hypothetical protein